MNIGLTKIYAATSANFFRQGASVRRLGLACAFACAGMSAALAGPDERGGQRDHPHQAQPRQEPGRDARQFESEARAEEQRRQQQAQQEANRRNAEAPRRSGRLTPDERRDLRRQINEAGMDLYPNTPRR